MKWMCAFLLSASVASADPVAVHRTAAEIFPDMPRLIISPAMMEDCGAGRRTNPNGFYCTSQNQIFLAEGARARAQAAYEVAHLLGHAVQVKHGVADVALREITRRRDEEAKLRGWVERQVNCIAGVLMAQAGQPPIDLASAFGEEPFTDAHWGRFPVNQGPQVSIGLEAAQEWLDTGYVAGDVVVCAVGEFSSDLLVAAQRSE